jgi:endonuclease/exonuclease/phosphatase (EEP) superfamily protein YafD
MKLVPPESVFRGINFMIDREDPGGAAVGRWRGWVAWALAVPGLLWAVVRLLGLERGPLVQLIAFTPYVAAWSVLPAALALAMRCRRAAVAAGLAAVALLACVLPRAVPDSDAAAGPRLRVLTANLLAGAVDPEAVVRLVRRERVHVLALQEYTPGARAALDRHGIADLLPHRVDNPEPGTSGSALYARHPLRGTGVRRNAGGFTQAYGTVLVPAARPVTVESAHPAAPYAVEVLGAWRADLAAQPPATPDGAVRVLAGDLNATLDHAPLRRLLDTGYRDAAEVAGAGLTGTWGPYDGDPIPPVTIDHVLADRRVGIAAVSVHALPGGDHRAVLATLVIPA